MSVHQIRQHSIVASSRTARANTQAVWVQLCQDHGADPSFTGLDPAFHLRFLELFGQRYRTGEISKSGQPVRAHTVETALGDVGAYFTSLDKPDPRLHPGNGLYLPALKKWLVALHKEDPSSSRTYPCSVRILQAMYTFPRLSGADRHARDLGVVGFFYMNRPGEVVHTSNTDGGRSSPFRLCDVSFVRNTRRLRVAQHGAGILNDVQPGATQKALTGSSESTLTYTDQKNCIKGEAVSHVPTGDDNICPTRALERIVTHLLQHGAPLSTPLHDYYQGGKRYHVNTTRLTALLQRAAKTVEKQTGIPHKKITTRSLRPGGATALLCAGQEPINIALVGRWRSEAMLRYLRAQTTPAAKRFAHLMLRHGNFTYTHTGAAANETGDDEFFGVPQQLSPALASTFDPTDDASDDDDPEWLSNPPPGRHPRSRAQPSQRKPAARKRPPAR